LSKAKFEDKKNASAFFDMVASLLFGPNVPFVLFSIKPMHCTIRQ